MNQNCLHDYPITYFIKYLFGHLHQELSNTFINIPEAEIFILGVVFKSKLSLILRKLGVNKKKVGGDICWWKCNSFIIPLFYPMVKNSDSNIRWVILMLDICLRKRIFSGINLISKPCSLSFCLDIHLDYCYPRFQELLLENSLFSIQSNYVCWFIK